MVESFALIGTAKGLIVYEFAEESHPSIADIFFPGFSVNMVFVDRRTGQRRKTELQAYLWQLNRLG